MAMLLTSLKTMRPTETCETTAGLILIAGIGQGDFGYNGLICFMFEKSWSDVQARG